MNLEELRKTALTWSRYLFFMICPFTFFFDYTQNAKFTIYRGLPWSCFLGPIIGFFLFLGTNISYFRTYYLGPGWLKNCKRSLGSQLGVIRIGFGLSLYPNQFNMARLTIGNISFDNRPEKSITQSPKNSRLTGSTGDIFAVSFKLAKVIWNQN